MKITRCISESKAISLIGLGCVTFGREIDQNTSFELMDYAQAQGISFFDTASAYGGGASENIIGRWRQSRGTTAQSILIATKILPPYSGEGILTSVDQSLARLQADTLDLVYFHHWDHSVLSTKALAMANDLVRNGKVRMLGASNFSASQIDQLVRRQKECGFSQIRFVQNNHNFAVSEVTDELRSLCADNEIDVVTYSPLAAGFLTGKYATGMLQDSRFARVPGHQQIYFKNDACERLAILQQLAERTGHSIVHLALTWAIHSHGISSVLIGARNKSHIDQAMEAYALPAIDILEELVQSS